VHTRPRMGSSGKTESTAPAENYTTVPQMSSPQFSLFTVQRQYLIL